MTSFFWVLQLVAEVASQTKVSPEALDSSSLQTWLNGSVWALLALNLFALSLFLFRMLEPSLQKFVLWIKGLKKPKQSHHSDKVIPFAKPAAPSPSQTPELAPSPDETVVTAPPVAESKEKAAEPTVAPPSPPPTVEATLPPSPPEEATLPPSPSEPSESKAPPSPLEPSESKAPPSPEPEAPPSPEPQAEPESIGDGIEEVFEAPSLDFDQPTQVSEDSPPSPATATEAPSPAPLAEGVEEAIELPTLDDALSEPTLIAPSPAISALEPSSSVSEDLLPESLISDERIKELMASDEFLKSLGEAPIFDSTLLDDAINAEIAKNSKNGAKP